MNSSPAPKPEEDTAPETEPDAEPEPIVGCNIPEAGNFDPTVTELSIGLCDFGRPKTLELTGKCDGKNITINTQAYPADIPTSGFKTVVEIPGFDTNFPANADDYNTNGINPLGFWIQPSDVITECETAFENTVGVVGPGAPPKTGRNVGILDLSQTEIPAYKEDGNGYVIVPVKS
tara:strand:+ start:559 stop:1086 length:528 start_codon:yes stop_codon:yes gene_type:complete